MLTFETKYGTLIIRGQDLRRIEDMALPSDVSSDATQCLVVWAEEANLERREIRGTAQENLDRIRSQEQQQMATATQRQAAAQFAGRGKPR